MKRLVAMLLVVLVVASVLGGCASTANTPQEDTTTAAPQPQPADTGQNDSAPTQTVDTVYIGVLLPLSGGSAYMGEYNLIGMQMYIDRFNEAGGVKSLGGAKIELVTADSEGNVETGVTEFERLTSDSKISAIMGPNNSTVGAVTAPLAIKYQIPYVINNCVADNVMTGTPNKYTFRANAGTMDADGIYAALCRYFKTLQEGGVSTMGVIYDASDWGTSTLASWTRLAEQNGVEIVVSEAITTNSVDLSTVINKIKAADPDFVTAALYLSDAVLFTTQMHEYKCDIPILGRGSGFTSPEFSTNVGEAGENVMVVTSWTPNLGGANEDEIALNKWHVDEYGYDMAYETCMGWLAAGTLCDALERAASTDREAIADALYTTNIPEDSDVGWFNTYNGVQFCVEGEENLYDAEGKLRYNCNKLLGETAGYVVIQIQNGEFGLVYPLEIATAPIVW